MLELLNNKEFKFKKLALIMALASFHRMNILTMNFKIATMTCTSEKLVLSHYTPFLNMQIYESGIF